MKKIVTLIFFTSILVLSGCSLTGNNTLKCRSTNTINGITTDRTYEIQYKGNDVKKVKLIYDYNNDNTVPTVNTDNNDTNNETNNNTVTNDNNATNDNNNNQYARNNTNDTNTTTNDNDGDNDVVDGVVGEAIDDIIDGVTNTILDISGLRNRHNTLQTTYRDTAGFTSKIENDEDGHYKVVYEIDYDKISDENLSRLGLDRSLDTVKANYTSQGLTCQ